MSLLLHWQELQRKLKVTEDREKNVTSVALARIAE